MNCVLVNKAECVTNLSDHLAIKIQLNLNISNTDGSFNMANWNSF